MSTVTLTIGATVPTLTVAETAQTLTVTGDVATLTVSNGPQSWGSITGTLSAQLDLQAALNAKLTAASNLSDVATPATALANIGGVPLAGGTMTGALAGFLTLNTRAAILASTPAANTLAYATDTAQFYLWDGTHWQVAPLALSQDTATPDMGYTQASTKQGYYSDVITDKTLENVTLGGGGASNSGALRVTSGGQFQVYLNGAWQQVVVNFRFLEDPLQQYELEHEPEGFNTWVAVMSGNSLNSVGLDGYPLVQQYASSIGAYGGVFVALDGGTF